MSSNGSSKSELFYSWSKGTTRVNSHPDLKGQKPGDGALEPVLGPVFQMILCT